MKKISKGLSAVVVALCLSAFTLHQPAAKPNAQTLRFASTDLLGNIDANPDIFTGTVFEAQLHYDWQFGFAYYCARQVNSSNAAIPGGHTLLKP